MHPLHPDNSPFGTQKEQFPSTNYRLHTSRSQSGRMKTPNSSRASGKTMEHFYPNKKYGNPGSIKFSGTSAKPTYFSNTPRMEIESVRRIEPEDKDKNNRYKTEICRNFKERGTCIYGNQCQFAHGRQELRDAVKGNKYKTKYCEKYWLTGYCAYGPRCNYIHSETDETCDINAVTYLDGFKDDLVPEENNTSVKSEHSAGINEDVLAETVKEAILTGRRILDQMEKDNIECDPKLEDLFIKLKSALPSKPSKSLSNEASVAARRNLLAPLDSSSIAKKDAARSFPHSNSQDEDVKSNNTCNSLRAASNPSRLNGFQKNNN